MEVNQEVFFNEQKIKEILIEIKEPKKNFEIKITNEKSKKTMGIYNYTKNEMMLYLSNISNNRELIKTAIHEYAHHFNYREAHGAKFWECYSELLEIADKKGLYPCNIDSCEDLKKITTIINKNNMVKSRKIFKDELRNIISITKILCDKINIDFEYFTVKYLGMEWYKRKNPKQAFRYFSCGRVRPVHIIFRETNMDDLLQKFFNDYSADQALYD